ncbi:MAG: hypothetical protein K2J38_03305 [Muribaculaceae bacterium]|nr:hypothetical protein [Muribaculaceae bacterium]
MNLSKKLASLTIAVLGSLSLHAEMYISDTHYDWSGLAQNITSTSKPAYEQAHDIYRWLTENISYDTTYSIHTADATYENKRGVCQGYAELYYRIAESLGLRSYIISGKSKDKNGDVAPEGHAWLFVYTSENSGILVDPTWGAGTVDDGIFTRRPNEEWFHADPRWMIFSHYPEEDVYQLLDQKVSYDDFVRIGHYTPSMGLYGYDPATLLDDERAGRRKEMPNFYSTQIDEFATAIQVPTERTLRIGKKYTFYLKGRDGVRFAATDDDRFEKSSTTTTNSFAVVEFVPSQAGKLVLCATTSNDPKTEWTNLVEYVVDQPTAAETAALEREYPMLSPLLCSMTNFHRSGMEHYCVDAAEILRQIRTEGFHELPKFYGKVNCRIGQVPWSGILKSGKSYEFELFVPKGVEIAVVNGENWHRDTRTDSATGGSIVTIPEANPGTIELMVQTQGRKFTTVLQYRVE